MVGFYPIANCPGLADSCGMNISLLYWVLMVLWLVFGPWPYWGANAIHPLGFALLSFILFILLGWKVFGPALKKD